MALLEQLGISVQWLKEIFLLGVDLTDDEGEDFPDSIFEQGLWAGVRQVERDLDLVLLPTRVEEERHDAQFRDANYHQRLRLRRRPLRQIESLKAVYGNQRLLTYPASWIQIKSRKLATAHVIPSREGIEAHAQDLALTAWIPGVVGSSMAGSGNIPQWWRVTYLAGFDAPAGSFQVGGVGLAGNGVYPVTLPVTGIDGTYEVRLSVKDSAGDPVPGAYVSIDPWSRRVDGFGIIVQGLPVGTYSVTWQVVTLPADIQRAIGLVAASSALNAAGDLIQGAGVATVSRSVDGLSTSVGTTSSATNAGYGARVRQHEREYDRIMSALKKAWKPKHTATP